MTLPLSGLLVVSLEQAVAAPQATCRLADAGARVIKIERPEGDFARGYDGYVHGESANFVWLNRGKESVVLDLGRPEDKSLFAAMLAKADVFVQNLKPGAIAKLGFPITELRKKHPRLICCSTRPPICSTRARMSSSSVSNCFRVCSVMVGAPRREKSSL